jgi:hypothetical protein
MTEQNNPPFDPFGAWTSMRDTYMDAWSKSMIDMVNSEEYARASATFLDNYLTVSEPFRRTVEKAMQQVLSGLNMPSRQDVVALAERLTNIETRLDDLDAKVDALAAKPAAHRSQEKE